MKSIRVFFANGYHLFLTPLYRRLRVEMDEKIEEMNELRMEKMLEELERIHRANLQRQERFVNQVSDEIIKINKRLDELTLLHGNGKVDSSLMGELVKIHQTLEALKHESNGTK